MARRATEAARQFQSGEPRILGLTGAIGCGKTTVGDILLEFGVLKRIDADRIVHTLMEPGTAVTAAVESTFGPTVLASNGAVDRAALAGIVFGDSARLRELETIVHPAVRQEIRERIEALRGREGVVVLDAVRLLQSDLLPLIDEVWVVSCSSDIQLRRLTEIRGMSSDEAHGRLAAQPSFEHERVRQVIDNSGTLNELRARVVSAWKTLIDAA